MPGTSITACSSGRVTDSIIVCAGKRAAVADDDDARELEARIDAARQSSTGDESGAGDQRDRQDDGAPVALDESRERS